jgi:hypothetical protein
MKKQKKAGTLLARTQAIAMGCIGTVLLFFALAAAPIAILDTQGALERGVTLPGYYPDKFDDMGHINRLENEVIVIDDSPYRLAPTAEYATRTERHATIASFHVGSFVGCLTNAKGEITSLWLLE